MSAGACLCATQERRPRPRGKAPAVPPAPCLFPPLSPHPAASRHRCTACPAGSQPHEAQAVSEQADESRRTHSVDRQPPSYKPVTATAATAVQQASSQTRLPIRSPRAPPCFQPNSPPPHPVPPPPPLAPSLRTWLNELYISTLSPRPAQSRKWNSLGAPPPPPRVLSLA